MGQYNLDYGNNGARLVAAFGEGWSDLIDGKANPQSKKEYAEEALLRMIKDYVRRYEKSMERNANEQLEKANYDNNDFNITLS